MKKNLALAIVAGAVSLTACGSKTDPTEKNFGAALAQYFEKKGQLCLNQNLDFPVAVTELDLFLQKNSPISIANQMAALEAAGLVKCEAADKGKRCSLTDAAKPFVRETEATIWGLKGSTDLCWGQKALDKVVKWEGPMKLGDYQSATITYTYKVNNAAEWTKKPEVQAAFPMVKFILDGAGKKESQHAVKLTSLGWEALGLD